MPGPEFFQTRMGRKFYEADVPRIAASLEKIAEALQKLIKEKDEYSDFGEKDWNDLLLSNVKNEYKELNLKAIKLSGFENTVYIEDKAIGPDNKVLKGYFGLFITKRGNIKKFWEIRDKLYDELKGGK